jgi:MerR family transcriptional regulator, mercuric resistance operon regulatory protein
LSLDEVRSLLDLGDGRNRRAVQSVTQARLSQIEDKLAQSQEIRAMREEAEAAAQRVEPAGSAPRSRAARGTHEHQRLRQRRFAQPACAWYESHKSPRA